MNRKALLKGLAVLVCFFLLSASSVMADGEPCVADFNCDGSVDGGDLTVFLGEFHIRGDQHGQIPCPCVATDCPCTPAEGDPPAPVPKTGQTTPRFTDNFDGTVTDNLTGLIWLKDANCFGLKNWPEALSNCNTLASGSCDLTDGSIAGDWRLPNIFELESLLDFRYDTPSLSNSAGDGKWTEGDPFTNLQPGGGCVSCHSYYWSSTTATDVTFYAFYMSIKDGMVNDAGDKLLSTEPKNVWPVRWGHKPCKADFNCDGSVDDDDLIPFMAEWNKRLSISNPCPCVATDCSCAASDGNPPAPVPRTGQTKCYGANAEIPCSGTGQDGDLQMGVEWPDPRFTANIDNNGDGDCDDVGETCDGTVTDNLTGLIWLKDANCFGLKNWDEALSDCSTLASGSCGLTDGSIAGDWRLPNIFELKSLLMLQYKGKESVPLVPNTSGDDFWAENDPFESVGANGYWTSTEAPDDLAWTVGFQYGCSTGKEKTTHSDQQGIWPVRGGQ